MIVFINNRIIPIEEARISPFDRGFLFADGVYESIRTYNKKLFRYEDHLQRLKRSLKEIRIDFKEFDTIGNIIYDLIKKNKIKKEALIYLQITRGSALPRTHSFPKEKIAPTIFISVQELKEHTEEQIMGIKAILQEDIRWLRCDIKSVSLLPVVLANQKASEENAAEAVLVRDGKITEGSHTNFFAVKDEIVFTAPLSNLILEGITRRVALELCKKLKINFREEFISINKLKDFDEFFITSTTKEITPVVKIDNWSVGNGIPGKVTMYLQSEFKKLLTDY